MARQRNRRMGGIRPRPFKKQHNPGLIGDPCPPCCDDAGTYTCDYINSSFWNNCAGGANPPSWWDNCVYGGGNTGVEQFQTFSCVCSHPCVGCDTGAPPFNPDWMDYDGASSGDGREQGYQTKHRRGTYITPRKRPKPSSNTREWCPPGYYPSSECYPQGFYYENNGTWCCPINNNPFEPTHRVMTFQEKRRGGRVKYRRGGYSRGNTNCPEGSTSIDEFGNNIC